MVPGETKLTIFSVQTYRRLDRYREKIVNFVSPGNTMAAA